MTQSLNKKNPSFMVRQGDLLIRKVDKIPEKLKLNEKSNRIVLEGEITNHNHEIESGSVMLVAPTSEMSRTEQERLPFAYLRIGTDTKLVHPEHNAIELPKGDYEVIRQREVKGVVLD